jgi:2-dehydropantoate 2-reductase
MKIVIMGSGAMGGYIGGRLAQAGRNVTFIDKGQHLHAIRNNGLQVQSPTGDFLIKPVKATDDPAEIGPVDLIFFCVKSYDVTSAAEMLRPVMGPQTVIIPVQNGIGHIEKIGDILGAEHLLGGVSLIMGHVAKPGIVQHHHAPDSFEFGEVKGGHSSRCDRIEEVLAVSGFKATTCSNIVERMWWKLSAYSGVGVFCVVRGDRGVIWATPETKALYRQAITEAVTVAKARDIPLADSVPSEHIAILDPLPPQWKPSMLTALEQGHPLELDAIQGALCNIGKEVGVPTPINDFIYSCLKPYIHGAPKEKYIDSTGSCSIDQHTPVTREKTQ